MKYRISQDNGRWLTLLAVGIGLLFSLYYLLHIDGGVIVDERRYIHLGHSIYSLKNLYAGVGTMLWPLNRYVFGVGTLLFGETVIGGRVIAAIVGGIGISVTGIVSLEMNRRPISLIAPVVVGGTYIYGVYAAQAKPEIILTTLVIVSIYLYHLWQGKRLNQWLSILFGATLGGVLTIKQTGIVFALPIVLLVLRDLYRTSDFRRAIPVLIGILATGIQYVPYLLVPHPPIADFHPQWIQVLVDLPAIGNLVYIVGWGVLDNVLGQGTAIYPIFGTWRPVPIWGYIYFVYYNYGIIYVLGLISAPLTLLSSDQQASFEKELAVICIASFIGLSLLSIRRPYYMLPLAPILMLLFVSVASNFAHRYAMASNSISRFTGLFESAISSRGVISVLLVVFVISASLIPPSPLLTNMQYDINTDSGADDVASFLVTHSSDDETIVIADTTLILRFHLDRGSNIRLLGPWTWSNNTSRMAEFTDLIETGKIDYYVALEGGNQPQTSSENNEFYQVARAQGEEVLRINIDMKHQPSPSLTKSRASGNEQQLVVYEFS